MPENVLQCSSCTTAMGCMVRYPCVPSDMQTCWATIRCPDRAHSHVRSTGQLSCKAGWQAVRKSKVVLSAVCCCTLYGMLHLIKSTSWPQLPFACFATGPCGWVVAETHLLPCPAFDSCHPCASAAVSLQSRLWMRLCIASTPHHHVQHGCTNGIIQNGTIQDHAHAAARPSVPPARST